MTIILFISINYFLICFRTEASNPKYKNQFQVILEAYCRKKGPYFEQLLKQVQTIETLTLMSKYVRNTPASYFYPIKVNNILN